MKHRIRLIVAALLLTFGLSACQAPSNDQASSGSDNRVLKIYPVPPAEGQDIARGLQAALGTKASVSNPSEGKLLVYAPRDAQASIEKAIATLGNAKASAQPAATLNVHVWTVDGETGNGADDPALKALEPTLDALRKTAGPMHFRLAQTAAAMASSGHQASSLVHQASSLVLSDGTDTQNFGFLFNRVNDDGVNLWLDYEDSGRSGLRKFNTQIEVPFGQYIVLAQAPGVCAKPVETTLLPNGKQVSTNPCSDKPALRLLIVRVDRAQPAA